jgi:mono/diheme cytochrome c family protein
MRRPIASIVAVAVGLGVTGPAVRSAADSTADAGAGRLVYERHCIGCHGSQGRGGGYDFFPSSVTNLTARETKRKSDADLREVLREGRPHPAMGPWKSVLSQEEIDAVVAYIRTFQPGPKEDRQ